MLGLVAFVFAGLALAGAAYLRVIPLGLYLALMVLLLLVALVAGAVVELRGRRPAAVVMPAPVDDYARPEGPEVRDA